MIEEIIAGISSKIYETFGDGYEIYVDRMAQNVKEPCFLISPLTHHQQAKLSNSSYSRYYREYPFCIFYYPERQGGQYTMNQVVAEKLYECLEYIDTEIGKLRGKGMRYSIEDKDLLNFVVKYALYVHQDNRGELPKLMSIDGIDFVSGGQENG